MKPRIVVWCKERARDPNFEHKTRPPCCSTWEQLPECACIPMKNYLRDYCGPKRQVK